MKTFFAEACQNTFVLFDCLKMKQLTPKLIRKAHQCLMETQRDDALLLVNGLVEGGAFSAQMVVLGLDGAFGEFCGNGSLACAAYLFNYYPFFDRYYLRIKRGFHLLQNHGEETYSITLPAATFDWNERFVTDLDWFKKQHAFQYVEMLEPHLVVEGAMSDLELDALGKELNQNKNLFPLGISINAWHFLDQNQIHVKTYERGVQRLTKSCGTGSIACASWIQNEGEMQVSTPGGSLKIHLGSDEVVLYGEGFFYEK